MTEAQVIERGEGTQAVAARPAAHPVALKPWQQFEVDLKERENAIVSMLPGHVSRARFINSAIAAVKQMPDLLNCTMRSLMAAITKSAQDGLLPDGREGVIQPYNEKKKDGSYEKVAQWNPMAYGLRKRARELDNIIIDAQVVHEGDHFVWHQGDDPRIEHRPATLGQKRGAMIGAYAIFKREDGTILHREIMDAEQIGAVRAQVRSPEKSLMWTKFIGEAWRKTVVRRGIKSVPCSEKLETIVHRDDDAFEMGETITLAVPPAPPAPTAALSPPRAPTRPKAEPKPSTRRATPASEPEPDAGEVEREADRLSRAAHDGEQTDTDEHDDYFVKMLDEWASAKGTKVKAAVSETFMDSVAGALERGEMDEDRAEDLRNRWAERTSTLAAG